ncbi:branched-chain amino acid aminotransferase [Pseudoscourfieldia marina]
MATQTREQAQTNVDRDTLGAGANLHVAAGVVSSSLKRTLRAPPPSRDIKALLAKPWGQVFAPSMCHYETTERYDAPVGDDEDALEEGAAVWETATGGVMAYGPLQVSPAAGVLNYGQGLFEGMKAYRTPDGRIAIFRPEENAKRAQEGCRRLCMPPPPVKFFVDAVKRCVAANASHVPPHGMGTLYLRPMVLGTGAQLGLFPAPTYSLVIYASPVGSYFRGKQADPIDLHVETRFHRACSGGSGGVKAIGNYAPTLLPQKKAKKEAGKDNCLYLDSVENRYIEEVGTCNIFVVAKDGTVRTPSLTGTILSGITRMSIIQILRDMGRTVVEERVSIDQLTDGEEAFVTGTAVGVCPIGSVTFNGVQHSFTGDRALTLAVTEELSGVQTGSIEDRRGWIEAIEF